jgi:hypothetical protein
MESIEVAATVRRAAAGERAAWDALVDEFTPVLWAVASGYRLGRADTAEVVQTSWLRLVEHLDRIQRPETVGEWLATTARREALRILQMRVQADGGRDVPPAPSSPTNEQQRLRRSVDRVIDTTHMPDPPASSGPDVFICHSSDDKEQVRGLYQRLRDDGVTCWFDEEDLLPGQDWEREIDKALKSCRFVLACLSEESVTRSGFVQTELRRALDLADRQPEDTIFLIPVRLQLCTIPYRLQRIHCVDMFVPTGYERLLRVLRPSREHP